MNHERRSLYLDLPPSRVPRAVAFHSSRWGLLVALALLTYLLYPVAAGFEVPLPNVGEVSRTEVLAPFDLLVRKSSAEIEREATALAATVPPVYDLRGDVVDSVLRRTDALFTGFTSVRTGDSIIAAAQRYGLRLNPEEAQYLLQNRNLSRFRNAVRTVLSRELARGVTGPATVESEQHATLLVRRGESERVVPRESLVTYQRFLDSRARNHPDPNSAIGNGLYVKLLAGLFQPTLVRNNAVTEQLRLDLRASVDTVKDRVRANERIVDANEVVTPEISDRLLALRAEQLRRGGGANSNLLGIVGQVLTNALVLAAFWLLLMLYRTPTYGNLRHMVVFALLLGLVIIGAAANRNLISEAPELIPIPFAAMLITVLFSGRVAIVAALVLAILISTQAVYGGTDALFVAVVGGVAAALSVRVIRRRTHLLASVAIVTGAFFLADVVVGIRGGAAIAEVGLGGVAGGMNALVSGALVLIALPIFESMARVTTDFTLLELSDPSRPLLRRLATEAPGTYAHSIAMANLCEAACNAIGADGLLARVGCYYHDIGKLKKAQFFVENQTSGTNPHDKLKPDVSAAIIRNHVREGLALAEEGKLPYVIKRFIPEHHGTMQITYFLDRARARTSEPDVKVEEYRYPGPRPHSVETAVAMLADGVEAAVRVLGDPTPQKVSEAIDHIVAQRIAAGQLDEAPITMGQLNRIKQEFARVLGGVYHNRIDYPSSTGGISADWQPASTA
jgi:putative nucleotidyltransferase with HDIG domain